MLSSISSRFDGLLSHLSHKIQSSLEALSGSAMKTASYQLPWCNEFEACEKVKCETFWKANNVYQL